MMNNARCTCRKYNTLDRKLLESSQGNEKYTYWQWTNYMTTEDSLFTQDRHGTEWLRNLIQKEENVEQRSKSRI